MEDFAAVRTYAVSPIRKTIAAHYAPIPIIFFAIRIKYFYIKGEVSPSRALRCALPPLRGHPATPRTVRVCALLTCFYK